MSIKHNLVQINFQLVEKNNDLENTNNICEICKKEFLPDQQIIVGKCHHAFHKKCQNDYKTCPIDTTFWYIDYKIN